VLNASPAPTDSPREGPYATIAATVRPGDRCLLEVRRALLRKSSIERRRCDFLRLGNTGMVPVLFAVAVIAGALLWFRGLRLVLAIAPTVALAVAVVAAGVTKAIVGRTRPPAPLHLVSESDASFPSGHATHSAAVFLTVALVVAVFVLRRPIPRLASLVAAAMLTGMVGVSRLVLGVHWPSDVLAGWALGTAVALGVSVRLSLVARVVPRHPPETDRLAGRLAARSVALLMSQRQPRHTLEAA
jgi:membrane-associated phospholipid phosphatase